MNTINTININELRKRKNQFPFSVEIYSNHENDITPARFLKLSFWLPFLTISVLQPYIKFHNYL